MQIVRLISIHVTSLLVAVSAQAYGELYRLNPQSGQCQPTQEGMKPRPPIEVKDFPHVESEFLNNNAICRQAKTCLDYDRLEKLKWEGMIPSGPNLDSLLSSDFKKKAETACIDNRTHEVTAVQQLLQLVSRQYRIPPIESKMTYEIVERTKSIVDTYLEDSQFALEALKKCLALDLQYAAEVPFDMRLEHYENELKRGVKLQRGCQRIWQPNSELVKLRQRLTSMRQARLGLQLMKSGKISSSEELFRLAEKLKYEAVSDDFISRVLDQPLTHQKDVFSTLLGSSFWAGSAKNMAPVNSHEKKTFATYMTNLRKRYPNGKLEDVLALDYITAINENPILIYFQTERPDSKELLSAFEKHQLKWRDLQSNKMDDVAYLSFPKALAAALKQMPPEHVGDYCVLVDHMISSRNRHKSAIPNLLFGLMAAEGGAAMMATKGVAKRAMALIGGARYSGSAFLSDSISKAVDAYNEQSALCSTVTHQANGLCHVQTMSKSGSEAIIGVGLSLAFGARPVKLLAPALLHGDTSPTESP